MRAYLEANINPETFIAFHAIHLTYWVKSMGSGWFSSCRRNNRQIPVNYHESIVAFLQKIDKDPQFCMKLVSSLPKETTERYYEERNSLGYEIPLSKAHLTRTT